MSDDLIDAFRATLFEFHSDLGSGILRIGRVEQVAAALIGRYGATGAAFLTAENPMGRRISDHDNAARMRQLGALLKARHCIVLPGVGRAADDSWCEASVLTLGLDQREADGLADHFQQAAYVWVDQQGKATLRLRAGARRYETDQLTP